MQDLNLAQMNDAQGQSLTAPITIKEILKAIQGLNPVMSPGSDGFTGAFYEGVQSTTYTYLT